MTEEVLPRELASRARLAVTFHDGATAAQGGQVVQRNHLRVLSGGQAEDPASSVTG